MRVGVIGGGKIAEEVHLPNFASHPDTKLAALSEIDEERLDSLGDEFNVQHKYTNSSNLYNSIDLDIISIATPPNVRKNLFLEAAPNVDAIYTEKPFALSAEEARSMVKIAHEEDLVVHIGYKHRYLSNLQRIRRIIQHKIPRSVEHIDVKFVVPISDDDWRLNKNIGGGGVLMDLFPHVLDVLIELFETKPEIKKSDVRTVYYDGIDDYAELELNFNGVTVNVHLRFSVETSYRIHYFMSGSDFWMEMDNEEFLTLSIKNRTIKYKNGELPIFDVAGLQIFGKVQKTAHEERIEQFIKCAQRQDTEAGPTADRAMLIQNVISKIYRSST